MSNTKKILWAIAIIPLLIGIILIGEATTKVEYSTSDHWVAHEYHHVYAQYSGEIVDKIEDNEECIIKGDTIIVKTTNFPMRNWGIILVIIFGSFTAVMIYSDYQDNK